MAYGSVGGLVSCSIWLLTKKTPSEVRMDDLGCEQRLLRPSMLDEFVRPS